MTILFDIARRVAEELGDTVHGKATAGSTTTISDPVSLSGYADDYFLESGLFVLHDAAGAGAAPENEFAVVSAYDGGTYEITLSEALTAAVASGDRFMLSSPRYPLYEIIGAINAALRKLGPIPLTDTSLSTASSQTEVTLPAAIRDLREVWIASRTDDADDNEWQKVFGWIVERAAVGSADTLIFPYQQMSNVTIKLIYAAEHSDVYDASDSIASIVDPRYLVSAAVYQLVSKRLQSAHDNDPNLKAQADEARGEMERYMPVQAYEVPKRTPRLMTLGDYRRRITSGY